MAAPRITSTAGKIGYVTAAFVVLLLASISAAALLGPVAVVVVPSTLLVAIVVVAARIFRGEGEPVAPPRPWWKMTAHPPAGYVLGALFLMNAALQALQLVLGSGPMPGVVVLAVHTLLGAAFIHSSTRLATGPAHAPTGR